MNALSSLKVTPLLSFSGFGMGIIPGSVGFRFIRTVVVIRLLLVCDCRCVSFFKEVFT